MANLRERLCQTEWWSSTLGLVSIAFLRAVGKGSSVHFAAFNPEEKERSEAPAIWQMSLKYPAVLYQRMKSESFLILSEERDIVQIQHTIGHFTPSKSLLLLFINSHRVACSIQMILTFLCLMV